MYFILYHIVCNIIHYIYIVHVSFYILTNWLNFFALLPALEGRDANIVAVSAAISALSSAWRGALDLFVQIWHWGLQPEAWPPLAFRDFRGTAWRWETSRDVSQDGFVLRWNDDIYIYISKIRKYTGLYVMREYK